MENNMENLYVNNKFYQTSNASLSRPLGATFSINLLFVLVMVATPAHATPCTVDNLGPADYSTIQAAIDDVSCDPVTIAAGNLC